MFSSYLELFDERLRIFSASEPGIPVDEIVTLRHHIYFVSAVGELEKSLMYSRMLFASFVLLTSTIVISDCSQVSLASKGTL